MKKAVAIAMVVAVAGIGVSVATSAVSPVPAWTTSKAERMLERDGAVQLAGRERAALEDELRQGVMLYSALSLAAAEMGDSPASLAYEGIADQYRRARLSVTGGIEIAGAGCTGSGRKYVGPRFRSFNCLITSEVLRVPTTELESAADGALPAVVQREPRLVGPVVTQLHIRVTGKSSFKYE